MEQALSLRKSRLCQIGPRCCSAPRGGDLRLGSRGIVIVTQWNELFPKGRSNLFVKPRVHSKNNITSGQQHCSVTTRRDPMDVMNSRVARARRHAQISSIHTTIDQLGNGTMWELGHSAKIFGWTASWVTSTSFRREDLRLFVPSPGELPKNTSYRDCGFP